jgi:uncharacterized membrane protein
MIRLSKELTSDITESEDRQNDLRKMKESGADGADIRNSVSNLLFFLLLFFHLPFSILLFLYLLSLLPTLLTLVFSTFLNSSIPSRRQD